MNLEEAKEKYEVEKLWDVIIDGKVRHVYRIDGCEHDFGKWNHQDPTLWLDMNGEMTHYDNSLKRVLWDLKFTHKNTSKFKWGEYRFNSVIVCEMILNGNLVYKFTCRDYEYAIGTAIHLKSKILDCPFDYLDPYSNNGRKIYYKTLPALVRVYVDFDDGVDIRIEPDVSDSDELEEWWNKLIEIETSTSDTEEDKLSEIEDCLEWKSIGYINWGSPLNVDCIDWFRN